MSFVLLNKFFDELQTNWKKLNELSSHMYRLIIEDPNYWIKSQCKSPSFFELKMIHLMRRIEFILTIWKALFTVNISKTYCVWKWRNFWLKIITEWKMHNKTTIIYAIKINILLQITYYEMIILEVIPFTCL